MTMTKERRDFVRNMAKMFDDLPDGAFLAVLEEQGIDVDELAEVSEYDEKRRASRSGRRSP